MEKEHLLFSLPLGVCRDRLHLCVRLRVDGHCATGDQPEPGGSVGGCAHLHLLPSAHHHSLPRRQGLLHEEEELLRH